METRVLQMPVTLPENGQCARCLDRLKDAVLQIAGVETVRVDPEESQVTLVYDPNLLALEEVRRRAERIGVEICETIQHEKLDLMGMDCPDCALKIEKAVGRLPGVLSVEVNFAAARMFVEYRAGQVGVPDIVKRLEGLGYGIEGPVRGARAAGPGEWWRRHKVTVSTAASGALLLAGYLAGAWGLGVPGRVLFAASILCGAYYMARGAVSALLLGAFDTNFLMLVAAVGAAALGQWAEGAMVVFLYSLGNALESLTTEKTRASIHALMRLAPPTAQVLRDGGELEVPVETVLPGEVIRVKPGAAVPLDGVVHRGQSWVNQAPITGEAVPVSVAEGSQLFAGSLNQEGSLEVRVAKGYKDTALARIVHLVEEAQAQKAPVQRFTETFGRIYTPAVIVLAVLCAVVVPWAFPSPGHSWIQRALTLLVVACPCALVISTPVAVAAAIGRAARQGVLIKGGAHLEALSGISVVAFDKTGTLTRGTPVVTEVRPLGVSAEELVALAATVEHHSEHPLADAVVREARRREVTLFEAQAFRALPGMGAEARVSGALLRVGSPEYLRGAGVGLSGASEELNTWRDLGRTVVGVAREDRLLGLLALEDEVREGAAEALAGLRRVGVSRLVMLTGDSEGAAHRVAQALGLDEVRHGLLPEQKVDAVRELTARYGRVAMVGDGVNDAPALAAATVGVAMGAAGTDTALETADIALMGDDLAQLPEAFSLSRKALRVVRQNVVFALLVVALLVGTTLIRGLRLSLGVAGHEGSALLVILNGMRLLRLPAPGPVRS
ncbi:MAG TPA: cation-translocating P-type ATPase [Armatimonadota bacterium]|jgi:Cd2+/Zn2+-exporting ATPase